MSRILTCVGTRPNFIKIMKFKKLFEEKGHTYKLLHTGQHFDQKMSDIFFKQLSLGKPDYHLGINAPSNNESVGRIIIEMQNILSEYKPDILIVPGDVNSTFACAFAAASLGIPVAHIESGLRSFDMTMPEERNRILTDSISELLFVTEPDGVKNLKDSGVAESKIKLVGNTIVDALLEMMPIIIQNKIASELHLDGPYCLITMHRPVNVDNPENLRIIIESILDIAKTIKAVFPIHPRTLKNIKAFGLESILNHDNVIVIDPLGYIEFLSLLRGAEFIMSDSGGVQIESSVLNIPCLTIRDTTELKITLTEGTNQLLMLDKSKILDAVNNRKKEKKVSDNYLWDGHSSERIATAITEYLEDRPDGL